MPPLPQRSVLIGVSLPCYEHPSSFLISFSAQRVFLFHSPGKVEVMSVHSSIVTFAASLWPRTIVVHHFTSSHLRASSGRLLTPKTVPDQEFDCDSTSTLPPFLKRCFSSDYPIISLDQRLHCQSMFPLDKHPEQSSWFLFSCFYTYCRFNGPRVLRGRHRRSSALRNSRS